MNAAALSLGLKTAFKSIPGVAFITIPLILLSFTTGVFFRGTDSVLFWPHMVAMIGFAGLSLWPNFKAGWRLPKATVIVALLLYWAYIWLSIIWSTVPYNSILFALIFSVLPFMFLSYVCAPSPLRWLKIHGCALGAGIFALALWGFVQFFILEPGARVHHPMLNPNNLSVVFNMAFFPALALYLFAKEKRLLILGFILALTFFAALLVTQSRGGLIACYISLLPFLLFVRGQAGFTLSRLVPFIVACVLIAVLVHVMSAGILGKSLVAVVNPGGTEIATVTERKLIWTGTWNMIQDYFWTGTGLASFVYFYPRYRLFGDYSDGYFAHMDPLQFWAEMGVFAPVLFYAVLVTILLRTIQATRASEISSPYRLWMYGFFCGLLALAGHSHISFHLYMPITLFLGSFLLAGWYLASEKILKDERVEISFDESAFKNTARSAFIVALLLPTVWLSQAMAGVYYTNEVQRLMQERKLEEARLALDKAHMYGVSNYAPIYDYEARYRLDLLGDPNKNLSREERLKL
ncbi:MAG: O-antigen ligase family protein, partial [Pseudomonadota bacterium]